MIDASDLYKTLGIDWHWGRKAPVLGTSSFEPLPGSQDISSLLPSLWSDVSPYHVILG